MLNGNASFNYTVNSTTIGTAVLTLNSTPLGIVDTTVTITTSGATGVAISVDKSVQDTSSDVQVSAQLTGPSGNLAINDTDITFIVKDAAGVIQSISTNATNTSGIAVYSFTQSVHQLRLPQARGQVTAKGFIPRTSHLLSRASYLILLAVFCQRDPRASFLKAEKTGSIKSERSRCRFDLRPKPRFHPPKPRRQSAESCRSAGVLEELQSSSPFQRVS